MKKITKIYSLLFVLITQFSITNLAQALTNTKKMDDQAQALAASSGLDVSGNLSVIFSTGIKVVLGFLGLIFLFLTIQAGFKWMTAQGNEKGVEEAKGTLKNSIIGLIIILAAYATTLAVFKYIPFGTSGGGGGGAAFSSSK